uniref:Uncharacterized protein n=1 Tax=Physcomitrium patens TaxID=3218 RepID=A0A2K1JI63_PHYPA|nr:hypothetical protein PHYPA_018647 [Physcomitrium patens]
MLKNFPYGPNVTSLLACLLCELLLQKPVRLSRTIFVFDVRVNSKDQVAFPQIQLIHGKCWLYDMVDNQSLA